MGPESKRLLVAGRELPGLQASFDLMIGVQRGVYRKGVYQGQDLLSSSPLSLYAELFNAFPEVTFCVSVLSSSQNQELASYSWIFPNVITSGHWWYSNIPAYIEQDAAPAACGAEDQADRYYSDAYKLEFVLPKYNMYRRILAQILADDFHSPPRLHRDRGLAARRLLLHDNARRIFGV